MNFLKVSKEAKSIEEVPSLSIRIEKKTKKSIENNEAIMDLFQALHKNAMFENTNNLQESRFIGYVKPMNQSFILEQMTSEEIEKIIDDYKSNQNQEEDDIYNKLNTVKVKIKKKKTFENGIASLNHEEIHEVLKNYKHYQDDNSLFKVSLQNSYFMNDRVGHLDFIQNRLLKHLEDKQMNSSPDQCDSSSKESGFHPLIHQEVVKHYLNATSPYRGLLLFHGLGSGKTCTSIGIIEAMKETKSKIFILTPASLRKNYQTQMKFCGSELFRKNENWEFVPYPSKENPIEREQFIEQLHILTQLPKKYLNKKNREGVYLIQKGKQDANFDRRDINEKELDEQIQLMIENRFHFISYNGITKKMWNSYYKRDNESINPFDHSTLIIDEGHNFVSRILNKINKNETSVSTMMYKDIISAENCRVIVLSGTPLINYPCEMGIMFNLIGGSILVLEIPCYHKESSKNTKSKLNEILKEIIQVDYIDFAPKTSETKGKYGLLKIIRNPYGFVKDHSTGKIEYNFEFGKISKKEYEKNIIQTLRKYKYEIDEKNKKIEHYDRFPDNQVDFNKEFIENGQLTKKGYFQNKIIGMVSYIGDNRSLMPDIIVPNEVDLVNKQYPDEEIFIEEIPMNKNMLKQYAKARSVEKEMDKKSKKQMSSRDKQTSSYQIFSRSACNFVFPSHIKRPYLKSQEKMSEEDLELTEYIQDKREKPEEDEETKKAERSERMKKYSEAIHKVLKQLFESPHMFFESKIPKMLNRLVLKNEAKKYQINMERNESNQLESHSPKFHAILRNILNPSNKGLHMLYSNFRTLEGIGIFKIVLDYYGYTEFKIKKRLMGSVMDYELDLNHPYYDDSSFFPSDNQADVYQGRKFYALYTGKEEVEEKEIIRNIFNGNMDGVPPYLRKDIESTFFGGRIEDTINPNLYGSLIQLLIISSSGAEGIDLKNVRHVHIMEPYWHPVRTDQVIGRARRICSHKELPEEEQTVKVFLYLLVHNQELLKKNREKFTELIESDYEKDLKRAISTDERLFRIMKRKKKLMDQFLTCLKVSAIDCFLNYDDKDKCLTVQSSQKSNLLVGYDYKKDKKQSQPRNLRRLFPKTDPGIGIE